MYSVSYIFTHTHYSENYLFFFFRLENNFIIIIIIKLHDLNEKIKNKIHEMKILYII